MRHELNRRFPALMLGGADPDAAAPSLDGVHGALTMSLVFGIPAEYYADNWPAAEHAYLTPDQVAALEPPYLPNVPVFAQILDQMGAMIRTSGCIEGYINWQGVLNTAYRLRGPEILTDIVTDPSLARHLFEVVALTMIAGMRTVYERQYHCGVIIEHATVSNCLVNMVAPEAYREHLFPFDLLIADSFRHFGVHNCAWNVDPYVEDYARLPNLGYVDMGLESDLARVTRLCPDTRRAVMYTPKDLVSKSPDELRGDLARIRRELSPCDIVMADIDYGTPDERVLEFARIAEEILGDPACARVS